jgi:hypothetical protein
MPYVSALKSWSASQEDSKNLGGGAELRLTFVWKIAVHAQCESLNTTCGEATLMPIYSASLSAYAFTSVPSLVVFSVAKPETQHVFPVLHNSGRAL